MTKENKINPNWSKVVDIPGMGIVQITALLRCNYETAVKLRDAKPDAALLKSRIRSALLRQAERKHKQTKKDRQIEALRGLKGNGI